MGAGMVCGAEAGTIAGMDILLVLTTLPDRAQAETLAAQLVDAGHAACATVLPGARSIYRWQGAVESADETLLLIKTAATAYPALEAAICAAHPYEVPEVIALPVSQGLPAYLAWVGAESRAAGSDAASPCARP